MLAISREEMVERLADLDRMDPGVELIDLFGSAAKGRARPRSYEREAAERLLQEGVEAALGINAHDCRARRKRARRVLRRVCETGRAWRAVARAGDTLAPSAGLRNRLVHEYAGLDDAKVLGSITVMLDLYPRYIQAVEAYLSTTGL